MTTRERLGTVLTVLEDQRDELRSLRRELPRDLRQPAHLVEIELDTLSRRLKNMRAFVARGGN